MFCRKTSPAALIALLFLWVLPSSYAKQGKIWPGMWLNNRAGERSIHISTDGTPQSGIPGLLEALKHQDPGIRESAASWLGAMGPDAKLSLPSLENARKDSDAKVRAQIAEAIAKIKVK